MNVGVAAGASVVRGANDDVGATLVVALWRTWRANRATTRVALQRAGVRRSDGVGLRIPSDWLTRAAQAAYFEGGGGKKNFVRRISAPMSSLNPPTRVKS